MGNEATDSGKRYKLSDNKTIMSPESIEDMPKLPELPAEQERGLSRLKGIFKFGKKEQVESKETEEIAKPAVTEPDFLKEIDLGHHIMVEPEIALWLNDGRVVKSLEELTKALKTMKGRIFNQHKEKGDIDDWVRDIIGNVQLVRDLSLILGWHVLCVLTAVSMK